MTQEKLIEKLYNEVCFPIVREGKLEASLNNFQDILNGIGSGYYKDLIIVQATYLEFRRMANLQFLSSIQIDQLTEYFGRRVISIFKSVIDEQSGKQKESLADFYLIKGQIHKYISSADFFALKSTLFDFLD